MRPLPPLAVLACLGAGALHASSAAAQVKPAGAGDIRDAIGDCLAITSASWIDLDKLKDELDWDMATRTVGRSREKISGIYAKPGSEALIIVGKPELKDKRCVVLARLPDTASYHPTAEALSSELGMPRQGEGMSYIWHQRAATIEMRPSGAPDAPNAEFAVTASEEDKS